VAHRDDEVVAEEDQDLAELDHLGGIDVAGRLQHHEDRVVVDIELRSLVRRDGVLYSQLVQLELPLDRLELLLGRLV